jgi:hypothetical protein
MNPTPNRLRSLIVPGLTTIALVISYGMWLIMDELARSFFGPWLLLELALLSGLIILSPGLFRRYHRKFYMVLTGLYVAALVIGWNVDWTSSKPFYRFYSGIRNGMTVAEVQQQLDQTFPPNGPYPKPLTEAGKPSNGQTNQLFRLEPRSAEIITVEFEQGRVIKAEYSPD